MRIVDLTNGEATYFLLEKKCFHCGKETEFSLSFDQYNRYIVNREYAQDVFPDLTPEKREVIISGTHPECWNAIFAGTDDDEFEDIDYSNFSDEELGFDNE